MAIQTIGFEKNVNISAQIGDYAFYLPKSSIPGDDKGVEWTTTAPILFGRIDDVLEKSIDVDDQDADLITLGLLTTGNPITPADDDFIMFAKDSSVNRSEMNGYYMQVEFINDSKEHAELFTVGSEIAISSK